jgi:hypothetical protein
MGLMMSRRRIKAQDAKRAGQAVKNGDGPKPLDEEKVAPSALPIDEEVKPAKKPKAKHQEK